MNLMKSPILFVAIIFFPLLLNAGSVRLFNDSAYDLKAVIRGSDGSFMGEIIVPAQKETVWQGTYGKYEPYGGTNPNPNQNYRSKTPYTVLWYCLDGSDYAVCDTVSTGALVRAQGCNGTRMCKPRKKGGGQEGEEGNYLYTPRPSE